MSTQRGSVHGRLEFIFFFFVTLFIVIISLERNYNLSLLLKFSFFSFLKKKILNPTKFLENIALTFAYHAYHHITATFSSVFFIFLFISVKDGTRANYERTSSSEHSVSVDVLGLS